jgi:hypothetical protein
MKKFLLIFAAALTVLAADPAGAPKIAGGPYVVNVTSGTATIVWLVETAEVSVRPAQPQPPGAPAARTSPVLRVEKTTLAGLAPNTRYEYSIAGGDAAGKGTFKTPPTSPGPFTFVVYGDNRTRNDVHRRVIGTLIKNGIPDFVVQTGDLVADGYNTSLWPVFFDIERDLLRQTSFFPALGNHERNTPSFGEFFLKARPYYSFDWGNAHFAVINSDIANVSSHESERAAFWAEQTRWLEEDLQAHQNADYRFVAAHHPPMTAVARRQGDNPQMTALMPMFEKYRVSAGLFGHDHNYQHYLRNGIHYIISGGGGAPLYDVDKPAPGITQKVVSIENFVSVRVDGKTAHLQTISIDGKVIDEFDIPAPAPL